MRGLDVEDLHVRGHPRVNTINRSRLKSYPDNIGTLVSPATLKGAGDEEVGLDPATSRKAREMVERKERRSLGGALRALRDPAEGLLLIYPISARSKPKGEGRDRAPLFHKGRGSTVMGVALAFPASRSEATIEYFVGSVAGEN